MMNKSMRLESSVLSVAIASLFAVSLPVIAQDAEKSGDWGKPSGIPWGPVVAYPEVDLTFKRNDNIYSQPSTMANGTAGNVKSSNISVLAPKIKLEAKTGPHTFDASYKVERGWFSGASVENYTDHVLNANAQWVFSGRTGLKLAAAYQKMHEDRGSDPNTAPHTAPDEYTQSSVSGKFGYGAEGAQGRMELDAGLTNKRYDNFRTTNAGLADNEKRDRDDSVIGATFYWRVAPKTQLLFQATQTKYDYKLGAAGWAALNPASTTLDSTDRSYLVGVTWEAAAKTTGIFKIGSVRKDFESSSRKDFTGASWDGTVKWSPLTYSNFDFNTGRSTGEATTGNASLDTKYGISWNHVWNSRLSSVASYSNLKNAYQHEDNALLKQVDTTNTIGLKLNYQWMRTVKIGAGYDRTDKTSNSANSAYKRNLYSVFLNAAI